MYLAFLYDFPLLPNIAIHQTRHRNELVSASLPCGRVMAALEGSGEKGGNSCTLHSAVQNRGLRGRLGSINVSDVPLSSHVSHAITLPLAISSASVIAKELIIIQDFLP